MVLGVDSGSHTVALAGVEGVVEEDQNPIDQLIPGTSAEILVGESSRGVCCHQRIGFEFSFSSLPFPNACSQSKWLYSPKFGSQDTQQSSTAVEVHHLILSRSIFVS